MKEKVIVAIDQSDWDSVTRLGEALENSGCAVKVGMELFYSQGTKAIEYFFSKNLPVFLDLKLHDIPNTVEKALVNLCSLPIFMINVHALGGARMMQAAQEARLKSNRNDLILIAVTQLTSTSQIEMNNEINISGELKDSVLNLATLTKRCGLDGVVCSALEVEMIKKNLGQQFKCITPGIRPRGASSHDQVRVMSPHEAIKAGSDYLVVGRAITGAKDPRLALENLFEG